MLQLRIAPPVQVPFVVVAETKVLPAGIGSVIFTPVSASGPLFVTTIVQVMLPGPSSCVAGEPVFVIERSTSACTHVDAVDVGRAVVRGRHLAPVLSTVPLPGQSPPVAAAVVDVMCTVNVRVGLRRPGRHRHAAAAAGQDTRRDRAARRPSRLPVLSIVQDRPWVGRQRVAQRHAVRVAVARVADGHREADRIADIHLGRIRRLHDLDRRSAHHNRLVGAACARSVVVPELSLNDATQ